MATVGQKLLTAEEFARLPDPPDGSRQELVDGVVETMPPPQFHHGRCCSKIDRVLGNFIDAHKLGFITSNDSGVILGRDPDTVRGPDVAFWSHQRLPEPPQEGYPEAAPDLVVEVLSPSDVFTRVMKKVVQYLNAGVGVVWVVVPEDRSVSVHRAGRDPELLSEADTLNGGEVLPGFAVPVRELFP